MVTYTEQLAGKIRSRPITLRLREILIAAGEEAGIDEVVVTSGGQARLGTPGPRTGSTRHDDGNAADLELRKGGRRLSFADDSDLPYFEKFVSSATARGATGIGAGVTYMGPNTMHVGFGSEAYWGAGGKQVNAPGWLKSAVLAGRAKRGSSALQDHGTTPDTGGTHKVKARSGLKLRAGPGTTFASKSVLRQGTRVTVIGDTSAEWVQVDLEHDGAADGYVFREFLEAV